VNSPKVVAALSEDSQPSSPEVAKPIKQTLNLLLRLIPRLLPAIVIGVASWLIRRLGLALVGAEAPTFVIGG
jgi:hypothetical protein